MIVVDTTVISYLTIPGAQTETALAVRQEDDVWAGPPLWESEYVNVLWKHVRHGTFDLAGAVLALSAARQLVVGRVYDVSLEAALALAVESGCTSYDCQYVVLARQLDVKLVTHDSEVLAAFPNTAIHPRDFLRDR